MRLREEAGTSADVLPASADFAPTGRFGEFVKKACDAAYRSLSVILFFAIWQAASSLEFVPSAVIPPPSRVASAIVESLLKGQMAAMLWYSIINVALGFAVSFIICIPAGLVIGAYYSRFEHVLLPFLRICEKLNIFALFPVFMILFGIGRLEKIMVVLWVSQWPLLFVTIDGSRNLDRYMLKAARSMGARGWKMVRKVIIPMMTPYIFVGMKSSVQLSFFMIIASEMVGANRGLGWLYRTANHAYNVPLMYGIILVITVLAIVINVIFTRAERHFLTWRPDAFGEAGRRRA
ncbi:MAG: ABC transporter permease [Synergistaceae bacterium]|jgi:NitT/TauT family transport system permease protein|nr:ABC transporter permease [Synergistaceae bacterium]